MARTYLRVIPSSEEISPRTLIQNVNALHNLVLENTDPGLVEKLNPMEDVTPPVPTFEFLSVSQGPNAPVEFYYGTHPKAFRTLENKLITAYPSSFQVERVTLDLEQKLIPPVPYEPPAYQNELLKGNLLYSDTADVEGQIIETTEQAGSSQTTGGHSEQSLGELVGDGSGGQMASTPNVNRSSAGKTSVDLRESVSAEIPAAADLPKEMDAGPLECVQQIVSLDGDLPMQSIDGPTWTEDGRVLARPTVGIAQPIVARWFGEGDRKRDWMTTIEFFSDTANPGHQDVRVRAPLAVLIEQMAHAQIPMAFQVLFQRKTDWTYLAQSRKQDLHFDRDTKLQWAKYLAREAMSMPSEERRREQRRDYVDAELGETSGGLGPGELKMPNDRQTEIDNKLPGNTFNVNLRAIGFSNPVIPDSLVINELSQLTSTLDHISGHYYGFSPHLIQDDIGGEDDLLDKTLETIGVRNTLLDDEFPATAEYKRLLNRQVTTGGTNPKKELVLNGDELGNLIGIPCSKDLTVEGQRQTRADLESQTPLPRPDPDKMQAFRGDGMVLGRAKTGPDETEDSLMHLPPKLMRRHYLRVGATGTGKTVAAINDILSTYESTEGPTIVIDAKGGGMVDNILRAFYANYGEDTMDEDVVYFPMPDVLPGFSFFDIRPQQKFGMDRQTAIGYKKNHYQEILEMAMQGDQYHDSMVAPTIIKTLIEALFDEKFGGQHSNRDTADAFAHADLEEAVSRMRTENEIPNVDDDRVYSILKDHVHGDESQFSKVMNAVSNRIDTIRANRELRAIFNNTENQFDLRELANENKVILFDMGDLRPQPAKILTGVILTNLFDVVQEHPQSICTADHESYAECRKAARNQGIEYGQPPCREDWGDDHVVNVIMDEASEVAISDVMTRLLSQGREFHLSIGLMMQYAEQMNDLDPNDDTVQAILNNIWTYLIGYIQDDKSLPSAIANEVVDDEEFRDRIRSLPRGDFIAKLPHPDFQEQTLMPFSLRPDTPPAGYDGLEETRLSAADEKEFQHFLQEHLIPETRTTYGIAGAASNDSPATSLGPEPNSVNGSPPDSEQDQTPDNDTSIGTSLIEYLQEDDVEISGLQGIGSGPPEMGDDGASSEETNDPDEDDDELDPLNPARGLDLAERDSSGDTDDTPESGNDAHDTSQQTVPFTPEEGTPVRQFPTNISSAEIETLPISEEDLGFLYTVLKAMNGELENYSLVEPMTAIENLWDADIDRLIDQGYLIRHSLTHNRTYYTVTPDGRDLVGKTKKVGPEVGDLGDNTPHRVGATLAGNHIAQYSDVQHVRRFSTQAALGPLDVVGLNDELEVTTVCEVEAGQTPADSLAEPRQDGLVATNNYESLMNDYEKLASVPEARSIWVCRNKEMIARILQVLDSKVCDTGLGPAIDLLSGRKPLSDVNDRLADAPTDGVDAVYTFAHLRGVLDGSNQ